MSADESASVATSTLPESDKAFRVEQHGIDFVPESERWTKPRDLFGMWAGASFQVEYFVYGVVLMAFFGLNFAQAVVVIVVGNLSFLLLGVASLQGPQAGTTAMTITRASYGPNGARLVALFNWATQVGFETEGLILIVYAAEILMLRAGFVAGTPAKVILILLGVMMQVLLPLLGHATIVKTLRALVIPFIALFVIMASLTLSKVHVDNVHQGGDWRAVTVGLAFVIALAGLGWTENGNDYSRYLPPDASRLAIVGWVFLGTALPETLIMILGAAIGTFASVIATGANPFAAFESSDVVSSWFVVPFLIFSLLQLFAINSLDLYSSGVSLQAFGLRVKRWQAVIIDTVVACGLTFYAIFSGSFFALLHDFADVVICWIAPWFAIVLVDWALRGFRYAPRDLQDTSSRGLYWRNGGVHWPAVIAQAVGTFLAVESVSQAFFVGQISRWIGADTEKIYPDFSIYIGIAAAGLLYFVLARREVRAEAARQAVLVTTD